MTLLTQLDVQLAHLKPRKIKNALSQLWKCYQSLFVSFSLQWNCWCAFPDKSAEISYIQWYRLYWEIIVNKNEHFSFQPASFHELCYLNTVTNTNIIYDPDITIENKFAMKIQRRYLCEVATVLWLQMGDLEIWKRNMCVV